MFSFIFSLLSMLLSHFSFALIRSWISRHGMLTFTLAINTFVIVSFLIEFLHHSSMRKPSQFVRTCRPMTNKIEQVSIFWPNSIWLLSKCWNISIHPYSASISVSILNAKSNSLQLLFYLYLFLSRSAVPVMSSDFSSQ